ncbi:DUF1016 family protein [Shigella dysenteriae]|nr:DUF1016 domain-containing protein [Shigella dysenteriae]EFZ0112640.1 DUF1016 family protein [Shigella dysenteriae]QGH87943.1 DUF1016 family protein [Shigella dysenteriae]
MTHPRQYGSCCTLTLIKRLSKDLSLRYKRGFSAKNLRQMRLFYLFFQHVEIRQTVSG